MCGLALAQCNVLCLDLESCTVNSDAANWDMQGSRQKKLHGVNNVSDWRHGSLIWSEVVRKSKCKCYMYNGKVKVKVQVYRLVSSAKRHSLDFTQLPSGHRTCSFISHASQLPGEHTAWLPFLAHGTIQTHKPSLSYQVPTYSWAERVHVRAKCLA